MLNDEIVLNTNAVVVIFGVDEMLTLDFLIPFEVMVGTTLRLAKKVLGKLRVPLVLVNGKADVVTAINDDLLISNVEFTIAVLLAVEVNFEMKT